MYKLKRGSISIIRNTKRDIDEAVKEGYMLEGECDKDYNITNKNPTFEAPKKRDRK